MKETEVIYFDSSSYEKAISELERYRELIKQLRELWYSEPLLQDTEFTYEVFSGLLAGGFEYLQDEVRKEAKQQVHNSTSAAVAEHLNSSMFNPVCSKDRLGGLLEKLKKTSNRPAERISVNCSMLEIRKTYPYISENLKIKLKHKCTIYNTGLNSELYETGKQLEAAYNRMKNLLDAKYKGGYRAPEVIVKQYEKKPYVKAALRKDMSIKGGKYKFQYELLDYGLQEQENQTNQTL